MGSEKQWLRDVSVCAVHGDSSWYVCYETKTHRLRLTHRGAWSMDDMDIYWKSQAEAFAALHVAPCPLEDPYARIAALESTERELREALKVLAVAADTPMAWKLRTCPECQKIRRDINNNPIALAAIKEVEDAAFGYPIAAAAVREASK